MLCAQMSKHWGGVTCKLQIYQKAMTLIFLTLVTVYIQHEHRLAQ